MAIAYLLQRDATYEDAFALVQRARPFVNPRRNQIARRKEMEQYYQQQANPGLKPA